MLEKEVKPQTKPPLQLDTEVQYLKGVGPPFGTASGPPWNHYDFRPFAILSARLRRPQGGPEYRTLQAGDFVSLKAQVVKVSSFNLGRSTRKMYDVLIRDSSGQIHCKYFRVAGKGYFERFTTPMCEWWARSRITAGVWNFITPIFAILQEKKNFMMISFRFMWKLKRFPQVKLRV